MSSCLTIRFQTAATITLVTIYALNFCIECLIELRVHEDVKLMNTGLMIIFYVKVILEELNELKTIATVGTCLENFQLR